MFGASRWMTTAVAPTAAMLLCTLAPHLAIPADPAEIAPTEKWSNVFGDTEATFHYVVRAAEPLEGRLTWSLVVNHRVVDRGEAAVSLTAGRAGETAVRLRIPPVKDGVILQGQLTVALARQGAEQAVTSSVRPLWIFPRNPFADRSGWLQRLNITLFDPEGKTDDVFRKAEIPAKFTRNVATLEGLAEGLLVIGEGVSWKDNSSLAETMIQAAAGGVPVLCLAPADGEMPLPSPEDEALPTPSRLSFRRNEIVAELDKRLDAVAWPPAGQPVASFISLTGQRDRAVLQVTNERRGWPWVEATYRAPRGRLVICGFGIVRHWEAGPAPRFLLAELFAHLSGEKASTASSPMRKD